MNAVDVWALGMYKITHKDGSRRFSDYVFELPQDLLTLFSTTSYDVVAQLGEK